MCMSYLNGDTKKALEIQMKGLPLVDALFRGQSDPGEKSIEPDGNGSRTACPLADRNGRKNAKY